MTKAPRSNPTGRLRASDIRRSPLVSALALAMPEVEEPLAIEG